MDKNPLAVRPAASQQPDSAVIGPTGQARWASRMIRGDFILIRRTPMIITGRKTPLAISMILLFFINGCISHTKGKLIESDIPDKYAFLIMDIQKDFMTVEGKLPVNNEQAQTVLKTINTIVETVDVNEIEIVYIGNEFSPSDRIANWFRNYASLKGEEGSQLDSRLKIVNNIYFSKNQLDAFSNDKFDQYLRNKKVNKLIIAGVFADQCVLATARGALQRGYKVTILSDGVAAKSDEDLKEALQKYKEDGVTVMSSAGFLEKLGKEI
jgi:nicotinamidase-related amidase